VRVPAALLALPLLAGATAALLLEGSTPDRLIVPAAGAALVCALAGLGFLVDALRPPVLACVVCGAGLTGYSLAAGAVRDLLRPPLLAWYESLPPGADGPVLVDGILRDDAAVLDYGVLLTIDVRGVRAAGQPWRPAPGGARLVVGGDVGRAVPAAWRAGRHVRVAASLRRPVTFANPGVTDDQRAQAMRGIVLTGSVKSAALVEVVAAGRILPESAAATRAWTRRVLARHVAPLDPRSAAIATAILIGDRTGLSDADERRLQDAGTYHVIAISGGNIAILTVLLIAAGRLLRLPYRPAAAASVCVLLFYAEVAGGSASVERAVTAATVFLFALLLDHRGAPLNVVAVAAALAVGVRPVTPADGGFLLSFGATAGILLGVPRLAGVLTGDGGLSAVVGARAAVRLALGILTATICAEIALAPVAATLFSRVTVAGLALNFAAIPLMTAVQCGSLALLAADSVSSLAAGWLAQGVHWSAWALVESARLVDVAPWMARDVVPPSPWLSVAYYASCLTALFVPRLRPVALAAFLVCAGMIAGGVGGSPLVPRPAEGVLRVVVLDVGQGDATVAVLPNGLAILVDAGGLAGTSFDVGGRVILPALRALGVRGLHALALTHGDPDHAGGAATVLERVRTANVWEGTPVPPDPLRRALLEIAARQQVVWRTVRPGDVERAGGVEIRVLHPPAPDWERQRVRNDDSVVLDLRHGAVSILLPGDIGAEGESAVARRLDAAPVRILKAAHHGSATSSGEAFLDAAHPRAVIFSAGRNNRFGHPAPPVVARFARRGMHMFNTADDGAVFVETDGRTVSVHGWRSGRRVRLAAGT
jgi:competence protein ComEC